MKKLFLVTLVLCQLAGFSEAQILMQKGQYFNKKAGIYTPMSTNKKFNVGNLEKVNPDFSDVYQSKKLLYTKEPIVLFNSKEAKRKAVAVLDQPTLVLVDTLFYEQIYRDTISGKVTFSVWYKIRIGKNDYFTDYKIHDALLVRMDLKKSNQTFYLFARNTGYEQFYDKGFPAEYIILITSNKENKVFLSETLPFKFEKEVWVEKDHFKFTENEAGFDFEIKGMKQRYKALWNGRELILPEENKK